ncbi:zinc-ribbon-domain-containing protein [Phascolomyces articulosus]|uniref:Zinc-ribbon-domain-containing protein n=1 Tax=Phascolomyces articulosus TaxID=60185 RepID=A0AAD5KMU5_9FUNG|nr:zinc-ribbon-domain-containing protein [Phascolomyces articulosus]
MCNPAAFNGPPSLDQQQDIYAKSYKDLSKGILGCPHYQRNVKIQANCCGKIFPCRICHDEACDHPIIRQEIKNMLCMHCNTLQPASQTCNHCGIQASQYYCDKCKLWDNDSQNHTYHCDECGLCRNGPKENFFHCPTCNVCMTISMKNNHRCIERSLESDCPICGEYMFTSRTTVTFMPCGHCIHKPCYTAYSQTSYQCPTCLKSMTDMSDYFTFLDQELAQQTMPAEYKHFISHIFCNDCEKRSETDYHFFYHKCCHCKSYNTTVLKTTEQDKTTTTSS